MQVALNRPCRTNSNEQSKPDPNPFTNALLQRTHHATPTCPAYCPSRKLLNEHQPIKMERQSNTTVSERLQTQAIEKEQPCQIHFLAEQTPLGNDTLLDNT
jgi:hypothetical protein